MSSAPNYERLKRGPAGELREQLAVGVAHTAEHPALNRNVVGSIPTARTAVVGASFIGASGKRWQR